MAKEEILNKQLYRLVILTLKYIPTIISLGYALYTILGFFEIELICLGHIVHLSMIPWLFIYLVSFVLRFCVYHRMPLYYVFICDLLLYIDSKWGIPVSSEILFLIHIVLILMVIIVICYSYAEYREKRIKRNIKRVTSSNS